MRSLHTCTLRAAAAKIGGVGALHDYLRVPSRDLNRWLVGDGTPPIAVFLKAVDLLDAPAKDEDSAGPASRHPHESVAR